MPARKKKTTKKKPINKDSAANIGYEAELWKMADALRGSMDVAEFKHGALSLLFLKFISDTFEEKHAPQPAVDANFDRLQDIAPAGVAGFVLANDSPHPSAAKSIQ